MHLDDGVCLAARRTSEPQASDERMEALSGALEEVGFVVPPASRQDDSTHDILLRETIYPVFVLRHLARRLIYKPYFTIPFT